MTYFLSRKTGHPAVKEFGPKDFRMWYDKKLDRLAPIATQCFAAEGFRPVLIGNGSFNPKTVVGEKWYEGKRYVICLADLREENPVAKRLRRNLMILDNENRNQRQSEILVDGNKIDGNVLPYEEGKSYQVVCGLK